MPNIHDLMEASKKALASKQAAQAAAAGGAVQTAVNAAAAAGGAGEGAPAITEGAAAGGATAAGEQGTEGEAAGAAGAAEDGAAASAAAAATSATQAAAAKPDISLDALVTKVTDLSISNAKLTTELEAMTIAAAAMTTVVSDSLDRMSIALGGGKIDVSKMSPEGLVASHAEYAAKFAAKFPIGGVAAVPAAADAATQEAQARDAASMAEHSMRVAAAAGSFAAKRK